MGAALLLLQTPKGGQGYAEYSPGSCINYGIDIPTCPSGCTNSDFVQNTVASGNGIFYLKPTTNTTPCGSAKEGETCNNPTQYTNVWDFQDCCAALGAECTGTGYSYMNCCLSNADCIASTCCLPDGQGCSGNNAYCCSGFCNSFGTCGCIESGACNYPTDCCSGNCYNKTCCPSTCPFSGCSNPGAFCWASCGCPGNEACSDCYTACLSEMSQGCGSACQECGICC